MTFGLTIEKLLLIGLIAVMIIGPERLPAAAESLRRTIQQVRRMARTAQDRVREELGPEVADVDWQRLDPRRYDPRRIIREALLAEPDAGPAPAATTGPRKAVESGGPASSAEVMPSGLDPEAAAASGSPSTPPVHPAPRAEPASEAGRDGSSPAT